MTNRKLCSLCGVYCEPCHRRDRGEPCPYRAPFDWAAAHRQIHRASDWHTMRAAILYNVQTGEVTHEQRQFAKQLNFFEFYQPDTFDHRHVLWDFVCIYNPFQRSCHAKQGSSHSACCH